MRNTTPRQVALYVAFLSALIFWTISLMVSISGQKIIAFIIGGVVVFALIYFIATYFLKLFLFEKINPLYRTIFSSNLTGRKKEYWNDRDILKRVKSEVEDWALNKKQEIAELKQLEKYRREFLGNVSHELKTPIFNIQGYILTLLDGGLEDSSINRLYLERTEKSINRMINIVEDLESISRLESGELKLQYESFDIEQLVDEVFELQEMLAKKLQITLLCSNKLDKILWVYADKKRITEVLNNLVVNSIKYGKKNGKTIVTFYDIGEEIMIEVTDSGIGIAEKDQLRIFERFYRTDKSRSRDQGGTGLGLSIVKHIIEAHNQTINVRSKFGEGSTFSFSLKKGQKPSLT